MISKKWFFEIIKKSNIVADEGFVNSFYDSIPSSYVSYKLGYLEFKKLYEKETEDTFPLLKEIVGRMDILEKLGADKEMAQEFIDCVAREKDIRARNGDWAELRKVINDRISLYPQIFNFNKAEVSFFEMIAEEVKKENYKKKK